MTVSLRCDCAFFLEKLAIIKCCLWLPESVARQHGLTVLVVATHENPEEYEAFILDKPVCLKKGIWHQVLALTEEAQVKIVENLEVQSEFYDLEKAIHVLVG